MEAEDSSIEINCHAVRVSPKFCQMSGRWILIEAREINFSARRLIPGDLKEIFYIFCVALYIVLYLTFTDSLQWKKVDKSAKYVATRKRRKKKKKKREKKEEKKSSS